MECTQLVDLIFFMGQSNMAGRGDAALAPAVTPGMGFEYRAVTDPAQLHPLAEPFGVNENDPTGVNEPGMKTGSMVSAFVNLHGQDRGCHRGRILRQGRFFHYRVAARHAVF